MPPESAGPSMGAIFALMKNLIAGSVPTTRHAWACGSSVFNMAVRWFCWSTDLVSECSLLRVCTPEMASKESLGRVRHFNLISQQVCAILCLWIYFFSIKCYFFPFCPHSNIERCAYMFVFHLWPRSDCSQIIMHFKMSPLSLLLAKLIFFCS